MRKFRIGVALGGGGVRGLAHIGILSVLEKNGIMPDAISGSSMGAVVGAMYAADPDSGRLRQKIETFFSTNSIKDISSYFSKTVPKRPFGRVLSLAKQFFIINRAAVRPSILTEQQVKKLFSGIPLPENFSSLKIPFCAVATNIGRGIEADFRTGDLRKAVLASASIQGIFPPVKIDGDFFLDGGTVNSVPISPIREYCDFVIACDVRPKRRIIPSFKKGLDVLARTDAISSYQLVDLQLKQADFILCPDVSGFHWANFKRFAACVEKGESEASGKIESLRKQIRRKKIAGFAGRLF